MPSHVNNQKLQPRFQRVSGHTAHVCRIYVYTVDRLSRLYWPAVHECRCTYACACVRLACVRLVSAYQITTHLSRRVALTRYLDPCTVAWSRELLIGGFRARRTITERWTAPIPFSKSPSSLFLGKHTALVSASASAIRTPVILALEKLEVRSPRLFHGGSVNK